jgi:3',5'-cyclic AMP phosphodiesterase CpdA
MKKVKKEKKKSKVLLKVLGVIAAFFAVVIVLTALLDASARDKNIEHAKSFETVQIENQLVPTKDENGYWTFTTDEEFKVMQLTDVHIGGGYLSKEKDAMALNAVAAMVMAEKPDLVIATGDIAYPVPFSSGSFNNLSGARIFASLMEQLGVYWVITYGNHDTEMYSYYDRAAISDFYENSGFKYCLFQSGPEDIDGYGNSVINVKNSKGVITQAFVLLDSHSYTDDDYFGAMWKYDGVHENQIEWYRETITKLNAYNQKVTGDEKAVAKSTAFLHIPPTEYLDAWCEYVDNGFKDTENVKYFYGVAGESKKVVYCSTYEENLFETMLELDSTKGIFCGHDHFNNFSVEYKGIRLTYGKSIDYLAYVGIHKIGTQRGCTMITYSPDGTFTCKPESYYQDKYVSQYEKEEVTMQDIVNQQEIPAEYRN